MKIRKKNFGLMIVAVGLIPMTYGIFGSNYQYFINNEVNSVEKNTTESTISDSDNSFYLNDCGADIENINISSVRLVEEVGYWEWGTEWSPEFEQAIIDGFMWGLGQPRGCDLTEADFRFEFAYEEKNLKYGDTLENGDISINYFPSESALESGTLTDNEGNGNWVATSGTWIDDVLYIPVSISGQEGAWHGNGYDPSSYVSEEIGAVKKGTMLSEIINELETAVIYVLNEGFRNYDWRDWTDWSYPGFYPEIIREWLEFEYWVDGSLIYDYEYGTTEVPDELEIKVRVNEETIPKETWNSVESDNSQMVKGNFEDTIKLDISIDGLPIESPIPPEGNSEIGTGAIVGIVIGGIVGLVLIYSFLMYWRGKNKEKKETE